MDIQDNSQIGLILEELQQLNNNLHQQSVNGDGFTAFKAEYFTRNEEMRVDLRELKTDMRNQSDDIDSIQGDVRELKDEFSRMKVELQPIMDMKKFVKTQVMRYSTITMTVLLGLVFGFGQV
jgi:chromosome segregation ATPase|tara:strand:- start:449 stop:814 length:366 start_codon:yes stop_codon:yes gene_type:complete